MIREEYTDSKFGFAVYDWMTNILNLRGAELQVFSAVHSFTTSEFGVSACYYMTHLSLGKMFKISRQCVATSLDKLQERGFIVPVGRVVGTKTTKYISVFAYDALNHTMSYRDETAKITMDKLRAEWHKHIKTEIDPYTGMYLRHLQRQSVTQHCDVSTDNENSNVNSDNNQCNLSLLCNEYEENSNVNSDNNQCNLSLLCNEYEENSNVNSDNNQCNLSLLPMLSQFTTNVNSDNTITKYYKKNYKFIYKYSILFRTSRRYPVRKAKLKNRKVSGYVFLTKKEKIEKNKKSIPQVTICKELKEKSEKEIDKKRESEILEKRKKEKPKRENKKRRAEEKNMDNFNEAIKRTEVDMTDALFNAMSEFYKTRKRENSVEIMCGNIDVLSRVSESIALKYIESATKKNWGMLYADTTEWIKAKMYRDMPKKQQEEEIPKFYDEDGNEIDPYASTGEILCFG